MKWIRRKFVISINGVRLVQRKFAQGVPLPIQASVASAPPPPERKQEQSYPPRNVYHNNMSARSLLDIVSLQNIHKHKQEPLVVLERLREDEIPSPPIANGQAVPRIRVPLRRRKVKGGKGNMCLRSGKRKSAEHGKGPMRKRKKLSSESTDDIPLVYYFNNRPAKRLPVRPKDVRDKKEVAPERVLRTPTPRRGDRGDGVVSETSRSQSRASDDNSFAFKEPSSPARLSYRLYKKKVAANTARQMKKALAKDARWSSLRSARAPSETRGVVRRLRNKVLLGKKPPKPAVTKAGRKSSKEDTATSLPGPSGFRVPRPPSSDSCASELLAMKLEASGFKTPKAPSAETNERPASKPGPACSKTPRATSAESNDPPASKPGPSSFKMPRAPSTEFSKFSAIQRSSRRSSLESIERFLATSTALNTPTSEIDVPSVTARSPVPSFSSELGFDRIEDWCLPPHIRDSLDRISEYTDIVNPARNETIQPAREESVQPSRKEVQSARKEVQAARKEVQPARKEVQATRNEADQPSRLEVQPARKEVQTARNESGQPSCLELQPARKEVQSARKELQPGRNEADQPSRKEVQPARKEADQPSRKEVQPARKEADQPSRKEVQPARKEAVQSGRSEGIHPSPSEVETVQPPPPQDVPISQKPVSNKKVTKGKGVGKKTVPKVTEPRKPAAKAAPKGAKKTQPKRAAKNTSEEPTTSTRLLRNSREPPAPAPNPDVYDFDAELETSRPPSGLRRRAPSGSAPEPQPGPSQPQQSPESVLHITEKEHERYMDVLLKGSPWGVQIKKKTAEECKNACPSASLLSKEIYKKQKNLIDNLANSPALLNKFFNCMPTELQDELGNLASEGGGREEAYLEPKTSSVLEAPTFYPTPEEFQDPIKYYDKIAPQASRYGLCKIVPPPGFSPPCNMSDTIRFAVIYQYISKMYSRWGPVSRELAAIKAHLRTQSVVFARSPLLDGSEVNLPKLYHAVERNGGLSKVIQRKRWGRVAEEMKLTKLQHPERKLDPIYMRYLLPYATLSDQERQSIMAEVEKCWTTKYQKMLERARNPFQRQNRLLGTECESESDSDGEDGNNAGALHEAEDCIVQGRTMNLVTFKKIATSLMDAHFEPSKQPPGAVDVEKAYWRAVLLGTEHIVANTASIDTGEEGYGFPKLPEAEYGAHPWNLKVLARNPNNVLRYLGPVLGVTVPTLHLSMLFSTSCWHRDPHGLPWTEYMHSGAEKIWYGIPRDESANFRRAVETLCPAYCQNKSIWLASEITMVPPNILSEHGVKLSRLLQKPGEYVLVFPEAHSCSITTGFGISESVYFASNAWLADVYKLFQELRNSCEPTMFSLEQLLLNGSADPDAPSRVCSVLSTLLNAELEHRRALELRGLKVQERPPSSAPLNTSYFRAWNTRDQDECEYCRSTLFLSKVTGLTGRKSAVCPEHALRLLETKKYKNVDLHSLEFLSSHTTSALEEMLERLEARPERAEACDLPSRASSIIDLTVDKKPDKEAE